MNLTKLFNFKYFMQNLKKSKGLVALLIIVVPIFTTLATVLIVNNGNEIHIPSKEELMIVNIIGMYIIPVLMSLVLFGYVYKKKSVDFINSQPINRKTIFVTNTICGIILMAVIQAITAALVLICGAILPNLIIFPQMILDIFIMMWISYSFTFVATNVAMSVSGTFSTQIVLTMLILFLVPFCIDSYFDFSNGFNYEIVNGEKIYNEFLNVDTYYTMPYQMFHIIMVNRTSEFNLYSGRIISRMLVLGAIYYFIGLHLFKNRKMENNEESFFNEKIHIIVKALTMFPMIILLNIADSGKEFNIIAIAVIITYYFVYDFCVKRKINLKSSLIYLVLTFAVLQGTCSGLEKLKEATPTSKLNIDNIASVKFDVINEEIGNMHYNSYLTALGGYIENEEIIKILFEGAYKYHNSWGEETTEDLEVITATTTENVIIDTIEKPDDAYNGTEKRVYCDVIAKTKNGKKYSMNVTIFQSDMNNIIEILDKDENYLSKIKNELTRNGILTISNYMILEDEEKEIIASEIENKINSMSFKELRQMQKGETAIGICRYYYKNHKLIGMSVNDNITQKTLEIVCNHMNKAVIAKLREDNSFFPSFKVYIIQPNTPVSWIYLGETEYEIRDLILEDEEFDVSKPYYTIDIGGREHIQYYTNKVDKINEFINRELEYRNEIDIDYEAVQQ